VIGTCMETLGLHLMALLRLTRPKSKESVTKGSKEIKTKVNHLMNTSSHGRRRL
jgi:hypothetical protein